MKKNENFVFDNECAIDLDAAAPHREYFRAAQIKKKCRRAYRIYRVVSRCAVAAILLGVLCFGLWLMRSTVGKTAPEAATVQATDTAPSSEACQVKMVVEMNGVILQEGQTYAVKAGDEIRISAFSTEAEIQRIGYYSNVNMDIRDTFDDDAVIILPAFEEGTRIQLFIEAVATNDDGTANTITKTGWRKYILEY